MYKIKSLIIGFLVGVLATMLITTSVLAEDKQPEDILNLPLNVPVGDNKPEENTTNGIDDDNDGVIDEGSNLGVCMVIVYNTDRRTDDEWELIVDGNSKGVYRKGKARFWDLMLDKGKHEISVKEVFDTDNSGNYSIEFMNCKPVKGPPRDPFNDSEQEIYTWKVEVE